VLSASSPTAPGSRPRHRSAHPFAPRSPRRAARGRCARRWRGAGCRAEPIHRPRPSARPHPHRL